MRSKTALMAVAVLVLLAALANAGDVMKVNGVPISAGQLGVAKYKVISDTPALLEDPAKATRAAVDQLVADVVLAEAARQAGLSVSEKQVNRGLETVKAQLGGRQSTKTSSSRLAPPRMMSSRSPRGGSSPSYTSRPRSTPP